MINGSRRVLRSDLLLILPLYRASIWCERSSTRKNILGLNLSLIVTRTVCTSICRNIWRKSICRRSRILQPLSRRGCPYLSNTFHVSLNSQNSRRTILGTSVARRTSLIPQRMQHNCWMTASWARTRLNRCCLKGYSWEQNNIRTRVMNQGKTHARFQNLKVYHRWIANNSRTVKFLKISKLRVDRN